MITKISTNLTIRILAIIFGIITIVFGFILLQSVNSAGFPFGDKTEYDRVVEMPLTVLSYLSMIFSLYLFYIARISANKIAMFRFIFAIIFYVIIFFGFQILLEYGLKEYTDINYGQGI